MKNFLFLFCFCGVLSLYAQKLDIALSIGTGKIYVVETITHTSDWHYNMPFSLMGELKFSPKDKTWGIKFRMHHVGSGMRENYLPDDFRSESFVSSLTTAILFEKNIEKNKFSYSFNFGAGVSNEKLQIYYFEKQEKFANIILGGHLSYQINEIGFPHQIFQFIDNQDI